MYLSQAEFLQIAHWKLSSQYGRARRLLESNSAARIERLTSLGLGFHDADLDFETSGRVTILRVLPGVGMGVASAILALCFPQQHAPIDFRVWHQLFDDVRNVFELPQYQRYLVRLRELAAELEALDCAHAWPLQLVDYVAWEYDVAQSRRKGSA